MGVFDISLKAVKGNAEGKHVKDVDQRRANRIKQLVVFALLRFVHKLYAQVKLDLFCQLFDGHVSMRDVTQVDIFDDFVRLGQKLQKKHAKDSPGRMACEEPDPPGRPGHREEGEKREDPQEYVNYTAPENDPVQLVKDHLSLISQVQRLEQSKHLIPRRHQRWTLQK